MLAEARMRGRLNSTLVLAVLGIFVLLAVVAIASTGSTSSGSADSRPPSELLLDTLFSLGLLALIPGAAILIYGLMQRKEIAEQIASGRYRRANLVALVTFAFLLGLAVYFGFRDKRFVLGGGGADVADVRTTPGAATPGTDVSTARVYEAEFAWIPIAILLGLLAVVITAFALAARRRAATADRFDAGPATQLADVLEETLDDLRADPDTRRAVVAAYARLERAFASAGLARREQETAEEYVPRALSGLQVDTRAARRLTDLYTVAKFSAHVVTEQMRIDAVAALERIRDDLRLAAERANEAAAELSRSGRPATT